MGTIGRQATAAAAKRKRATVKAKPHDCLKRAQRGLAEKFPNVRFATRMQINFKTGRSKDIGPILAVEKIDTDKRTKLPTVIAEFCPFCGKRVEA